MSVSWQNSFQLKKRKIVRMSPVFVFSHHNLKKKIGTKGEIKKTNLCFCRDAGENFTSDGSPFSSEVSHHE